MMVPLRRLGDRAADHVRRLEDIAVEHMAPLAMGTGGAIILAAAFFAYQQPAPANPALHASTDMRADMLVVGSIGPTAGQARPLWTPVAKPTEIVSLEAPQFDRNQVRYRARRGANGDREDALHFESTAVNQPEARVALVRRSGEAAMGTLFIDMVRAQAERSVAIAKAGPPGPLPTKFGDLEASDMTFVDADGQQLTCVAFRSPERTARIALSGWYCAPQGAHVERPMVSCFVDRLAMLRGGEDGALKKFFTEAEARRKPCPTQRVSAGRKTSWLENDGSVPPIRR